MWQKFVMLVTKGEDDLQLYSSPHLLNRNSIILLMYNSGDNKLMPFRASPFHMVTDQTSGNFSYTQTLNYNTKNHNNVSND